MIKTLIEPEKVLALAYGDAEFTPKERITQADILACEQRYLRPVIGEKMLLALANGVYLPLLEDFVAPALAYYVRFTIEAAIHLATDASSAVTTASTAARTKLNLMRARQLMLRLTDFLDANQAEFPEYCSRENVLKKCRVDGGFVQVL